MQDNFYAQLQPFDEFETVADSGHYVGVPEGWHVIITDIVDSTKAIAAGRYKEVNMMGAACITSVQNACNMPLPYVFGGDGATIIVPDQVIDRAMKALRGTCRVAHQRFKLKLRVGSVPMADISRAGHDIRVAKYALSPGNDIAMLRGSGVAYAESVVKASKEVAVPEGADDADLNGLSCNWEPISPLRGKVMSLIVQARGSTEAERARCYRLVLGLVEHAMGQASPVSDANLHYHWPPQNIITSAKARGGSKRPLVFSIIGEVFGTLLAFFLFVTGIKLGGFSPKLYRKQVITNSDYRKFDGVLRMVLDCSEAQVAELTKELNAAEARGDLFYGMHLSDHALMTCLVKAPAKGEHLHFIDGADGGYALAASKLKQKLKLGASAQG